MAGNFVVNFETTLTNTNETNVLYIVNSNTNVKQLAGFQVEGTSLDNSVPMTFRIYTNPTVTNNGTALTPVSRNFSDGNISSMNIYSAPTTSAKGTRVSTFSVATAESYVPVTSSWYLFPSHTLLITGQSSTSSKALAINILWTE